MVTIVQWDVVSLVLNCLNNQVENWKFLTDFFSFKLYIYHQHSFAALLSAALSRCTVCSCSCCHVGVAHTVV